MEGLVGEDNGLKVKFGSAIFEIVFKFKLISAVLWPVQKGSLSD